MAENKQTIEDVCSIAGDRIVDLLKAMVHNEDKIVDWFYKPNKYFLDKSPYEICKEGKQFQIEKALMDVITGNCGG